MTYRLELDGWKSNIMFSSAHILLGHKRCGVLHGHTYAINLKIYGNKDEQDFVIDFAHVKKVLRDIADSLDHKVLIPKDNSYFKILDKEIIVEFEGKKYVFPKDDCIFLPMKNITAENLSQYVLDEMIKGFDIPENISKLEIGIDEGFGQGAWIEKIVG